jgi:CubicO group peptidase (beta-lactamase class C family)
MLYERGCFQLDDPVAAYIPALAGMPVYVSGSGKTIETEAQRQPVTIRQLLTHTSGLIYGLLGDSPVSHLYQQHNIDFRLRNDNLAGVIERLGDVALLFQPGTCWHYGISTDVLGRLIEVVSGQALDRFLDQQIFQPLGMSDTGFYVPDAKLPRFAALYGRSGDGMALSEAPDDNRFCKGVTTFSGGGGLVSTMADYFRFSELLRRKGELDGVRLLGRKTVEYMTGNHLPGDMAAMGQPAWNESTTEGIGFGLGFSVMLDPARAQIIGSAGEYAWGGAASTAFWIDPFEDMTVIFMTQLLPSGAYPLRRELRVLTYQALC